VNNNEPAAKQVARRTTIGLTAELIKIGLVWLWPLIAPAAAIAAGYVQGVPWIYVVVAAAVTFGAGATGALRFSELRVRMTPINKLAFTLVTFSADFVRDKKTGQIRALEKAQIGLQLQNTAHFGISYLIEDMQTSFEGMINQKPERPFRWTEVPPGSFAVYRDAPIDTKNLPLDKASYEGSLKFKIRYGYPDNEKHVIDRNLSVTFSIDKKTGNTTIAFWDVIDNIRAPVR
jgi:hypothetical protein